MSLPPAEWCPRSEYVRLFRLLLPDPWAQPALWDQLRRLVQSVLQDQLPPLARAVPSDPSPLPVLALPQRPKAPLDQSAPLVQPALSRPYSPCFLWRDHQYNPLR